MLYHTIPRHFTSFHAIPYYISYATISRYSMVYPIDTFICVHLVFLWQSVIQLSQFVDSFGWRPAGLGPPHRPSHPASITGTNWESEACPQWRMGCAIPLPYRFRNARYLGWEVLQKIAQAIPARSIPSWPVLFHAISSYSLLFHATYPKLSLGQLFHTSSRYFKLYPE